MEHRCEPRNPNVLGMRLNIYLAVLSVVLFTASWILPAHAQNPAWPDEDPAAWGIAIIDVETTGLDPAFHEMIDLGVIYVDLDGRELGRFFVRIHPDHPERIGDVARSINGYEVDRWQQLGAFPEEEAFARFLAFHERHRGERTWIMMAYNAYFDRGFLDAWLKEHGTSFREIYTYFVLDLPSMAWGAGITDLQHGDVARKLGEEPETQDPLEHTGLSGAEFNLALYRALLKRANERSHDP